ncbi:MULTISPECIES: PRC-barrel domain-containing protein [unclassified Streptomyces]|uniref:PRC-barrel domain-containing protein n=1 Tax=unclassified Streptomyces TaxID=2593676 RepID=UPI002DD8442A|nr:PRC-barrel domain-containing protein [Streptomyces sp. NBC_01445]WSE03530.1 PRC-barrel domain-containing protein [Streptomyces sp. NBC_01445]
MTENIWSYPASAGHTQNADLTGYKVEATDGHIGKVDKHSNDVGSLYIVVDTGVWIFGKEVLLPAGTIIGIDAEATAIQVARTKDQIKSAPEFDKDKHLGDAGYHEQVGTYYDAPGTPGSPGAGPTPPGRPAI